MAGAVVVVGFTSSNKDPQVFRTTEYGAGRSQPGQNPSKLVLVGNMTSSGAATEDQDVVRVTSESEVDYQVGAGSELAVGAYFALKQDGVELYLAPCAEAAGAVEATCRLMIGGTWTTSGQLDFYLHDRHYSIGVAADDVVADVVANLVDEFGSNPRSPVTPSSTTGKVTLTTKSKGARNNDYTLYMDDSLKPSGLTITLVGTLVCDDMVPSNPSADWMTVSGTPLDTEKDAVYVITITTGGGRGAGVFSLTRNGTSVVTSVTIPANGIYSAYAATYGLTFTFADQTFVQTNTYTGTVTDNDIHAGYTPFGGGSGTDDVTNVTDILKSDFYRYQAWASNDTSNGAVVKAYLASEAAASIKHTSHAVWAKVGTQAAGVSFTQAINDPRESTIWYLYGLTHPFAIAALGAAKLSVIEPVDPNHDWDKEVFQGVLPQMFKEDVIKPAGRAAALNSGLSPLQTQPDGSVTMVRWINSKSLDGSQPDYRTYDRPEAIVPDMVSDLVESEWDVYRQANPYIGPDPAAGAKTPPERRGYPLTWNAALEGNVLRRAESANWIMDVSTNPPVTEYSTVQKCFLSAIPTVITPIAHQFGATIRQTAA